MQSNELVAKNPENATAVVDKYLVNPGGFLEDILGMELDTWQKDVCDSIAERVKKVIAETLVQPDPDKVDRNIRIAVSSGHGIGKTALTAGINQWFIAVHPDPYVVCTANTKQQLTEKTWRELAKWHQKSLLKDWFEWTATQFRHRDSPATWFATAVPQTEHNSEAFAGVHEKYVLQIFDEASKIPSIIFDVAEGASAKPGGYRIWLIFGNPTNNTGGFYDACFGARTHRWHQIIVDARDAKYSDQRLIDEWKKDHGDDSDFFRVRVKGLPPRQSITNLIGVELAEAAVKRYLMPGQYDFAPKVLSVDSARFGDDETVISYRQGMKLHWQKVYRGLSETKIAEKTLIHINEVNPDTTFFDVTGGYGAGAHDILKDLGYRVVSVNFAEKKGVDNEFENLRIQMWDNCRVWLERGDIPNDQTLVRDLTTPDYFYNKTTGKKQLESKDDLKKRLGRSPDKADSLVISFAYPVKKQIHQPVIEEPMNWRAI